MDAVQLVGHGGVDKLHYRTDVLTPVALTGEVLIKVAAAGVNNTDINTRIGWYSKTVDEATGRGGADGFGEINEADATWSGVALSFPRIQGADCCGRIVSADEIVDRRADLVAGTSWPQLLDVLRRGGRYSTAGAIAGPLVELDVRTLYLKDLTLFGCTFQEDEVFANLVSYIERGEIRPLVAKTFPLSEIRQAQTEFLAKAFTGKLVLVPPD